MNNKDKRTKFSLSPDFKRHSLKLVPLRMRFPKIKIKEVPGWHQPAELQESIKVSSIRPYKVKSKRDFYSPLFYATEDRQNYMVESKSSNLLPKLVKNNKLNWNSMKVFNNLQMKMPQGHNGKLNIFFPNVSNDVPESENTSSPMRPVFSHRSLDPPNNPQVKFLTKESPSPLISYSIKKKQSLNSKFKLPQGVNKETQYQFEESKEFELNRRKIKSSQGSRSTSLFFTKGTRIKLLIDEKRSKSAEKFKRTQHIRLLNDENSEIMDDPQKEVEQLRRNLSENDEKILKSLQSAGKISIVINENDSSLEKSRNVKEENRKKYLSPESSELNKEKDQRQLIKVQKNISNSEKKHKKLNSSKLNSEDSEFSLSSSYSESEEQGKNPKKNLINDENGEENLRKSKKSRKSSKNKRKTSEITENELNNLPKKRESEESVTFSPNITKREINAVTATPVTKYSTSPNRTPAIKSPEPPKSSKENPQSRSKDSKISIKFPTQSKKPTIKNSSSEKQYLKSKTNKNPPSTLTNPSNPLKNSNPQSRPSLKKTSKKAKSQKKLKTIKNPEEAEKLDPNLNPEENVNESPSKIRKSEKKVSGTSNFKSKSRKKSSVNASNRYDSPFSDDIKLEIRITEAPDASVMSNITYNPDYLHTSQNNNSDDVNQSRISGSSSFLHVRRKTRNTEEREKSRRMSRKRITPISKTEKPRSNERKRMKNNELSKKSVKINVKSSENDSSYSSSSEKSSFSKYSAIRKTELDQKFLGKSDSVSGKAFPKLGMTYLKEFVSSEVKKKIGKLDPINNFIYNFSFAILKSIKSLAKVKNFNSTNRNIKKKKTKWLGRIETELFDREALGKGKLRTNKKLSETKIEVPKPQNTYTKPPKVQKKVVQSNVMFYPREVTLKAMHSRNNSDEKSIKKTSETNEKIPKPKKTRKKLVKKSSESESSIEEEEEVDHFKVNRSKKSLLYELSHQELTLQIAKQIIGNNENGKNNSESSFSETENSDASINEIDLQNEINQLAVNLKLSPKSFAFGPEINLNLLKQNQILFNFKELEDGKYEIDFDNLKRYSKKQEFIGMQKLNSDHSEAYSNYTLQIKNDDCLTEEQKYHNRMQRLRFSRKKLTKIKESLKNPETIDSSFNAKRPMIKAFSPNPTSIGAEFDERVYLRLRDSKSMLSNLPHTKF